MVVGQIDLVCIAVLKAKDDAPIAGDHHAPVALQVALERMETIARQIEITGGLSLVQMEQHIVDAVELVAANLSSPKLFPLFCRFLETHSKQHKNQSIWC